MKLIKRNEFRFARTSKNFYQTLGVSTGSSQQEIKRAYYKLVKLNHPDRGGSQRKIQDINEAYETLSDPKKRSEYDQELSFGNSSSYSQSQQQSGSQSD